MLGVTRMVLQRVATQHGYAFEEGTIRPEDLSSFDAVFLTSTSSKVLPIRSIDEHSFGAVPEALSDLMRHFDDFLSTCNGKMSS